MVIFPITFPALYVDYGIASIDILSLTILIKLGKKVLILLFYIIKLFVFVRDAIIVM